MSLLVLKEDPQFHNIDSSPITFTKRFLSKKILRFKPLYEEDREELTLHYLRLSESDRIQRFFSPISDSGVRKIVESFEWDEMLIIGAWDRNRLIGAGELGWITGNPEIIPEFAFSVEESYRKTGVATFLLQQICEQGIKRGFHSAYALWLPENHKVGKIFSQFSTEPYREGTVYRGEFALSPVGPKPLNQRAASKVSNLFKHGTASSGNVNAMTTQSLNKGGLIQSTNS